MASPPSPGGSSGKGDAHRSSPRRGHATRPRNDADAQLRAERSARTRLEERLRDALSRVEQMEQIAQAGRGFLSIVAHELQQPVAVIAGFASILGDHSRALSEADSDKLLEAITRQSERLSRLIRDLLDLSRMEAGEFSVTAVPLDLDAAVAGAVADAPPPEGRTVSMEMTRGLWVLADPQRLGQVLVNLLSNAYRYGGPAVRVEASRSRGEVAVSVADDGDGVPEHLQPTLFERYRRASPATAGGTGLGLAIAKGFVEAFGGRIWYESASPRGARFTMLLRSAPADAGRGRDVAVKRRPGQKGGRVARARILIVDDEPDTLFLLRMILEREGHEVVEAGHGAEALARLVDAPVDIIITDLMMPVMDGRELVRRLRADPSTSAIPIMLASANPDRTLQVDATLLKPFPPQAVLESIEQLLGGAA